MAMVGFGRDVSLVSDFAAFEAGRAFELEACPQEVASSASAYGGFQRLASLILGNRSEIDIADGIYKCSGH
jgi:hypothetical protein